ncbi:alpha/beta hydrolase domain-containing protein [Paracoccus sp. (in: a-proteobacteria)]|uniref:alpha/beta hydrolase domain-containing protein n=1 Tax=Paracoccus sp. TaxID=267 RepID=UPI003A8743F3
MTASLAKGIAGGILAVLPLSQPATSKVVDFEVTRTVNPAFEGHEFGNAGAYERIDGIVRFAIDPASGAGSRIVDLDKVPVNADGLVEYETEVSILRPIDASKGNGTLFYEVLNRGTTLAFRLLNLSEGPTIPETVAEAGDGFLMKQGYTLVWSGWQTDLPPEVLNLTVPTAEGVTGLSREEFVFDKPDRVSTAKLVYPAADQDPEKATLTVRLRATDPRATAPDLSFRYLSGNEIEITKPEGLDAGAIFEFIYPATGALPAGLAFTGTSDLVSFLRGNPGHDVATPLEGIDRTIGLGVSQSGRFLRDLIYHGFNADEAGNQVFDGAVPHIAGSRKSFTNFRFAQAGRYSRQHEDHDIQGDQFPFTYTETTDPFSGRTESILTECTASNTCPKLFHTDTDTEFWQARAGLLTTSAQSEPLTMPDNVRLYFLAGTQHFTLWSATPEQTEICRFASNPISPAPIMRALLTGLNDWIATDKEPPASRYPTLADGTLVPLSELSLPHIAGAGAFIPAYNVLQVRDYSSQPPGGGGAYPVLVPQMDEDGNATGGIEMPAVSEALATLWGWNPRNEGFAEGDLCGLTGSRLPFPANADSADGDSRKPVSERYADQDAYVAATIAAAEALVQQGLMLEADIDLITERARTDFASVSQ